MAGAGFGILSTELAYWLYPKISPVFAGKKGSASTMISPVLNGNSLGLGLVTRFN